MTAVMMEMGPGEGSRCRLSIRTKCGISVRAKSCQDQMCSQSEWNRIVHRRRQRGTAVNAVAAGIIQSLVVNLIVSVPINRNAYERLPEWYRATYRITVQLFHRLVSRGRPLARPPFPGQQLSAAWYFPGVPQ